MLLNICYISRMSKLRWVGSILKYVFGVLCWLIIFGQLQSMCVFDIMSVIDSLWVKELHSGLVENAIGEVALHAEMGECDRYIYMVKYHPSRMDVEGETRSLSALIDVSTWREVEHDSISVTFLDSEHKYVLYTTSDGEYIRAVNR